MVGKGRNGFDHKLSEQRISDAVELGEGESRDFLSLRLRRCYSSLVSMPCNSPSKLLVNSRSRSPKSRSTVSVSPDAIFFRRKEGRWILRGQTVTEYGSTRAG